MWPNPKETADLVTFTEEILNGKLHFLCGVIVKAMFNKWIKSKKIIICSKHIISMKRQSELGVLTEALFYVREQYISITFLLKTSFQPLIVWIFFEINQGLHKLFQILRLKAISQTFSTKAKLMFFYPHFGLSYS